jgi:threonine dehydrogenase-like Zn-dependent dehydrogenase
VLVIGCGPIGILHCLTLLERGFEVWLTDTSAKRVALAQWCLHNRGHVLDEVSHEGAFDLVMVSASSAEAVRRAERLVRHRGIVYLFAGLNANERMAMDPENTFFYERLHRTTRGIVTTARFTDEEKSLLYLGHSGYFENLVQEAIAAVARNAAALDRAVTGVIAGLARTRIQSRLPGGVDWVSQQDTPAIISVLHGLDLRDQHCKLLVLPNQEHALQAC